METQRRKLLQKSHTESGSVVQEMMSYDFKPVMNDGANYYGNARIRSVKNNGNFSSTDEIELPLVSASWDVAEFENSFIHLECDVTITLANKPEIGNVENAFDKVMAENQYLWVGLKAATHIINDYRFKHNDSTIPTTNQSKGLTEAFLYSTFKAESEIANHKFVFSQYKEVAERDNSTCGLFIPLIDFKDTNSVTKRLDIIIPYNELLPLEAFNEFPNCVFGDLTLNFHATTAGFVYAEVNPKQSITKAITEGRIEPSTPHLSEVLAISEATFDYPHAFEQSAIPSQVQYVKGYDTSTNKLTFSTQPNFCATVEATMIIKDAWAEVKGYKILDSARLYLCDYFQSHVFAVPGQKIETYPFHSGPTASGLKTSCNAKFTNTTECYVLCPTNSKQTTVFRNPMLNQFGIEIDNKRYPDTNHSTIDAPWIQYLWQGMDFEGMWKCNDDLEESLVSPRIVELPDKTVKILKPWKDNTSWVAVFQLERQGSGGEMWFDGLTTNGPEKVELKGIPLFMNKADVYYDGTPNQPNPTLVLGQDTYWIWRIVDGVVNVQYVVNGTYQKGYQDPSFDALPGTRNY